MISLAIATLLAMDPKFCEPTFLGVTRWGPDWVARAVPPRRVDVSAATSRTVFVEGLELVIDVAGDRPRYALGLRAGRLALMAEATNRWTPVDLPRALKAEECPPPRLAAGAGIIAITAGRDLWWRQESRWRSVQLPAGPSYLGVFQNTVLAGSNAGEFGGGLVQVETRTGRIVKLTGTESAPVVGMALGPSGPVIALGLSHMGGEGALGTIVDGAWKAQLSTAATSFDALAIDEQSRTYVLTGDVGVLRVGDGAQLTPGWHERDVHGDGLAIDGDTAIIATQREGILLWKLGTPEVRRVMHFADP